MLSRPCTSIRFLNKGGLHIACPLFVFAHNHPSYWSREVFFHRRVGGEYCTLSTTIFAHFSLRGLRARPKGTIAICFLIRVRNERIISRAACPLSRFESRSPDGLSRLRYGTGLRGISRGTNGLNACQASCCKYRIRELSFYNKNAQSVTLIVSSSSLNEVPELFFFPPAT